MLGCLTYGRTKKVKKRIEIITGEGIRYTVPQYIDITSKEEKIKIDTPGWHLFSYLGFLSEKSLKTAYDLQHKTVFNCIADYNGPKI